MIILCLNASCVDAGEGLRLLLLLHAAFTTQPVFLTTFLQKGVCHSNKDMNQCFFLNLRMGI